MRCVSCEVVVVRVMLRCVSGEGVGCEGCVCEVWVMRFVGCEVWVVMFVRCVGCVGCV